MFEYLYLLLEILTIICCLHGLYSEVSIDKWTTAFLIITDLILFSFIHKYEMSQLWSLLMLGIIGIYTLYEFPFSIRKAVISNVLYTIIVSLLQLIASLVVMLCRLEWLPNDILLCLINFSTLLAVVLMGRCGWLHSIFSMFIKKNVYAYLAGIIYCIAMLRGIVKYKTELGFSSDYFLIILVFGLLLCIILYSWQKEKEKAYQKDQELKMHQVYDESFQKLFERIRKKQHDFNNHLQAITSMHYTIDNYEELVREQKAYCQVLNENMNRYYDLLSSRWKVVAGFLFSKFEAMGEKNIKIAYDFRVIHERDRLPEYVVIELIGILLDNAAEEVSHHKDPRIGFSMFESEEALEITVMNPVVNLENIKPEWMFRPGCSSKEGHSGLGLSKIADYQQKYHFKYSVSKKNGNLLMISIRIE